MKTVVPVGIGAKVAAIHTESIRARARVGAHDAICGTHRELRREVGMAMGVVVTIRAQWYQI